jgi:exopolysaccharide biosynthesis polyprenyl glycosylphosphotransferase
VEPLPQVPPVAELAAETLPSVETGATVAVPQAASAWQRSRLVVDAMMLLAATLAAQLGARAAGFASTPAFWLLGFAALVVAISYMRGAYAWRIRLQAIDDLWSVVATTALAGMAVLSIRVIIGDGPTVADETLRVWAFAAVYVGAGRIALDWSQIKARRHGELGKPTLIVGAGDVGRLTAKRLLDHPEFGLQPIGFLDKEPREGPIPLPVLGASWDLDEVVERHRIQHVIVTFSTAPSEVLLRLLRRCEERNVGVSLVPRLYERMNARLSVEHIGGLPLLSVRHVSPKGWQFAIKHALDRLLAAALTCFVLPLLALAALAVHASMGRPIFFRQRRVGRDGQVFEMLKFRTMQEPRNEESEAAVASAFLPADTAPGGVEGLDRRTRIGALLRAISLDELPQLLNVLKGEMSLVGPRPERPEFVELFEDRVHAYGDRHRVKAGITGWAQVHGLRGKTSISDRAEWDNYYIENWSLWLDMKIMLMTFFAVLSGSRRVE